MTMRRKLLIFFSMAMLIAIGVTSVSYAGEDHPITDALKQYMGSVTESDVQVSYEGELATFTIYSEGTGWTTWQDVACTKRAFDAVRQESVRDQINSIRIVIIDSQGEVIYDAQNNYINCPPEGELYVGQPVEENLQEDSLPNSDDEAITAEDEPVEYGDTVVVENDATSEEIESKLNDIENDLRLQAADDASDSAQSEVIIENRDGEVVGYYAADYENGAYFSWSEKPDVMR